MKDIAIFGVGGFGREVLTLIQDINRVSKEYNILGFFDDGHDRGEMVNGYPVLGKMDELNQWSGELCLAVSIGNPKVKKSVIDRIVNSHVSYPTLIHPSVLIGDKKFVEIGQGCIICAGNILTTNIRVGNYVIMNLSCTTGHDSIIGDYSAFMPSVNISGEVTVGDGVYVGTGVKIINQVVIGEYATIGAGAVVVRNVPGYCTAVGVPAKVLIK